MKKFLAVGINHFLRPGNELAGCVADSDDMIKIATSLQATGQEIQDKYATKPTILAYLNVAINEAKVGNLSYLGFSWSGHGTHYPRPQEPDGLGEALCCYDLAEKNGEWDPNTLIKDSELHDLLNQVPQTCIVEVWLDTCYSGGMDRALLAGTSKFIHNPDNPGYLRVANTAMHVGLNSNIVMWCACSEAQESEDAYIAGGPHGAFTYYWCEAFKKNPKASRIELLLATRKSLKKNDYDQFPRLKAWNKEAQRGVGK